VARINVDNEFLCDPRMTILATKMPRHEAYGALVALWEVGQSYWKKNKGLIPLQIFEFLPRAQELLASGFVEVRDDGVYCKGANERWGFLLGPSEAGKKSAEARLKKFGTAVPIHAKNNPTERPPNDRRTAAERPPKVPPEHLPNAAEHSSSSSSSSSNSKDLSIGRGSEETPSAGSSAIALSPPPP